MDLSQLTAISPVDGRYRKMVTGCDRYFSEYALMKYRVMVEVEYFIALCELPLPQLKNFRTDDFGSIRNIYESFSVDDAKKIKDLEKVTNHDVKAVEYYLKGQFEQFGFQQYKEFIHFGLTSQDINNTAVPYSLKQALKDIYFPLVSQVVEKLSGMAGAWKNIPMLARTHGQPASPTRVGKEILVFVERLTTQYDQLKKIPVSAKFGGSTGNFNAHAAAYPEINWVQFADDFIERSFNLSRLQTTTQIDHYDNLAALFDCMKRINTILTDLNRDIWTYISLEYFTQKIGQGEVGSSVMPHKVNPIDFENSEGNLGIANALFEHLSAKLPVSRLQRDLTDSTVLRNTGIPFAHTVIALKSLLRGLDKIIINEPVIKDDLEKNWVVLTEAIQTILRREGYPHPYEALKTLTRTHKSTGKDQLFAFIDSLEITESVKTELKKLTPFNYTGI
ncbi:MAG: adenylosuccinate lyase [Bacteroidales bacterium]|nr:adenylosuccinate lyase [Bacteroidales bacterium]